MFASSFDLSGFIWDSRRHLLEVFTHVHGLPSMQRKGCCNVFINECHGVMEWKDEQVNLMAFSSNW